MLFLTFTVGTNRYAVDVTRVVEVVPRVELRTVPHAPAFLAGLLGYRGNIVPVIDLSLLLGTTPSRDRLSTRIILVNDSPGDETRQAQGHDASHGESGLARVPHNPDSNLLGLIAESVSDLTYIQPEQIVPTPVVLPQAPYLGALVQTEAGIVQLMVVERIRHASFGSFDLGQDVVREAETGPDH